MAIKPYRLVDTDFAYMTRFPVAAGTYHIGQTLGFSGGQLVPNAAAPQYMSMTERTCAAGDTIAATPLTAGIIWVAPAPSLLELGGKYKVASDGLSVTDETGGVFLVEQAFEENGNFFATGRFV